jgi:TolB-like protein
VVDAVQCAVIIQATLKAENANLPPQRKMEFRIGINLGDVIVEGERIYGDGVNIAARIEGLAEPGGICLSGIVHEQVKHKVALHYEGLGEQEVKNIAEPVQVWRVVMDDAAATLARQFVLRQARPEQSRRAQHERFPTPVALSPSKGGQQYWQRAALVVGVVLLVGIGTLTIRYFYLPPSPEQPQGIAPTTPPAVIPSELTPALPLPDKPSIVVLPFVNMSKDPEQDYFSDGLTEVLTSDLSKISSLFVISRNSAFTYKGKAVKVQDVGREMGVRYVLEGSVQKADGQVRIVAQLIDTTTGGHIAALRKAGLK